jgi:hypothetical protein
LRQLVEPGTAPVNVKRMLHARRPYPQLFPKYRNPAEPPLSVLTDGIGNSRMYS